MLIGHQCDFNAVNYAGKTPPGLAETVTEDMQLAEKMGRVVELLERISGK